MTAPRGRSLLKEFAMNRSFAALPILLAALAGCATDRPISVACPNFDSFRIPVEMPGPGGAPASVAAASAAAGGSGPTLSPLAARLAESLAAPTVAASAAEPGSDERHILVLSGGGQWGAFGAGLIDGWSRAGAVHPRPAKFDVVMGISTGALQSTFAFLGREQDPALRKAYAPPNARDLAVSNGSLFFLRHGSLNDLRPLESYIRAFLRPMIDAVASPENAGRTLLVGVVDGLDGRIWAIDLTKIARNRKLTGPERESCYTGALLASAAVPVVFQQVQVDGRPYLDGGVRQSVFAVAAGEAAGEALGGQTGTVHILINGDPAPKAVTKLAPKLLPTLGRVRSIVFNQIELTSIDLVTRSYPTMRTYLATAAGQQCLTTDDTEEEAFDRVTMDCLSKYGFERWAAGDPWRPIGATAGAAASPRPARR